MICTNPEGYYRNLAEYRAEVQTINDAGKVKWYPKDIFIL